MGGGNTGLVTPEIGDAQIVCIPAPYKIGDTVGSFMLLAKEVFIIWGNIGQDGLIPQGTPKYPEF